MQSRAARRGRRALLPPRVNSDALHQQLLEGLDVGVAQISRSGKLLYCNRTFRDIVNSDGAGLGVAPGTNLKKTLSAASWAAFDAALRTAKTALVDGEMRIDSGGAPRMIRLSFSPLQARKRNTTIRVVALEVTDLVTANEALRKSERSIESLSARILRVQDEERRRIARDLHDTTGQELAVISMCLGHLSDHLAGPPEQLRQTIQETIELVNKVEEEIRTLSYVLHPPLLDELGVHSALNWYIQGFSKRSGIDVTLKAVSQIPRLSTEKETALFRVVQEALSNVLRHSGSKNAEIRVRVDANRLELAVRDSGRGISPGRLSLIRSGKPTLGVGIAGMRERIRQLGGDVSIHSGRKGTRVRVLLPLGQATEAVDSATSFTGRDAAQAGGP